MTAQVVIENATGHPLDLTGCGSLFAVALARPGYQPQIGWPTCAQRIVIPSGRTVEHVTVMASYLECSSGAQTPPTLPTCLPGGPLPPLPVGQYQATLFQSTQVGPAPEPIPVRVIQ